MLFLIIFLFSFSSCEKDSDSELENRLPKIIINTEGSLPIESKELYQNATIVVDGAENYPSLTASGKVRGRGNSTWTLPKKPYRIKLDKKTPILGLAAEKDWVLLANYLDETHMLNAVAMKIGHLMKIPFTNNIIPVELILNGEYQGLYMLTEQIEVKQNRVNVGEGGFLFELDSYFDDEWRFRSTAYNIPINLKYPTPIDREHFYEITDEFDRMTNLISDAYFPNNSYLDYIDGESVAKFLLVQLLTDNQELNHPKSIFSHKTATGKFTMGPIWDFDWAFGYDGSATHFTRFDTPLFWEYPNDFEGTKFFSRLASDPYIVGLIKQNWEDFKENHFEELMIFIDEYELLIKNARVKDFEKWGTPHSETNPERLKSWLKNRADFLDKYIKTL
jgi:hypothetical protein